MCSSGPLHKKKMDIIKLENVCRTVTGRGSEIRNDFCTRRDSIDLCWKLWKVGGEIQQGDTTPCFSLMSSL